MRSRSFMFKKTKKIVEVHKGVCLDLTGEEASILLRIINWYKDRVRVGGSDDGAFAEQISELLLKELGK